MRRIKEINSNRIARFILFVVFSFFISSTMGYGVTTVEYWTVIVIVISLMMLTYREGYSNGWKDLRDYAMERLNEMQGEIKKMKERENDKNNSI